MNTDWFSAMLRFVILIEHEGAERLSRSVVVFRAGNWDDAREKALSLGRGMECTFTGGTGLEVRWRLEAIETLDQLGNDIADGREVYSEPVDLPPGVFYSYGAKFHPEDSKPGQSGV